MSYMIHTRLYPIWHKGIKLPQARANRPKAAHSDLHCVSPDTLLAGFDPLIALLLYLLLIATASILVATLSWVSRWTSAKQEYTIEVPLKL